MTKRTLLGIVSLLIMFGVVLGCTSPPAPSSTTAPSPSPTTKPAPSPTTTPSATTAAPKVPAKPDVIRISGQDVGTGGYLLLAAQGEGVQKQLGIRLRLTPVGTAVSRIQAAKTGIVDTQAASIYDAFTQMEGLDDFANIDWGPQPLRLNWLVDRTTPYSMAVWGDSPIKTPADLKGKKVAYQVGTPSGNIAAEGFLRFGNLTWSDVKRVDFVSSAATNKGLIDGTCDASMIDASSSDAAQLAASPHGIRWLPVPQDDKAGWARFWAAAPLARPFLATEGAGISKDKPVWTMNWGYPYYASYESVTSDAMAYWITKSLVEAYPVYKDTILSARGGDPKTVLDLQPIFPWHKGSIQYLKDAGLWTDKLDRNQKLLVARQDALAKLWNDTLAEAADKKIKVADFQKFWLDKRAAAFPTFFVAVN